MDPRDPLSAVLRGQIGDRISAFLDARAAELAEPVYAPILQLARDFTAGGKRIRPAFCAWGYVAAGGGHPGVGVLDAAASLDLLHVSALVHDDIIDASDTRRGIPAVHRQLERLHRERGGRGDAEVFGRNTAILVGDLLWSWSMQLFDEAELAADTASAARAIVAKTRTEVTSGQYLDLLAETLDPADPAALELALRVIEYKTSRYTVIRPVQVGAALAGASASLLEGLARFASPLGRAFQLRDDLLGVFGDASVTGKPSGDDLREGKQTVLIAEAMAVLSPAEQAELATLLGTDLSAAQVLRVQQLLHDCGAVERVEHRIADDYSRALAELTELPLTDDGRAGLAELARLCVERQA